MTTLPDRPQTALLVIDAQNGAEAHRRDEVVGTVAGLVARAHGRTAAVVPAADVAFAADA